MYTHREKVFTFCENQTETGWCEGCFVSIRESFENVKLVENIRHQQSFSTPLENDIKRKLERIGYFKVH